MDSSTIIIIVVLFAIIAIFSFVVYQQRGEAEVKLFGVSLKIKGSNEKPQPKPAISAKDIISREGGLLADDSTGRGIEIESIETKDDVLLSSSQPASQSNMFRSQEIPANNVLTAQALSAGGNITIQQFVGDQSSLIQQLGFFIKHIGLENVRENRFADSQFTSYSNVWKSLQALRLAGDDLWSKASDENILKFANKLRETVSVVREGEIFFEDEDRESLNNVLAVFSGFEMGKRELIHIRSKREIHDTTGKYSIVEQINQNRKYKLEYEGILDNIRVSFRKKLSS